MTQLNIEGRTVNVDDGFLKLSPEDQEATVHDIARQLNISPGGAAPAAAPPTSAGMIATELGRGVPVLGPAITNRYGSAGREAWEAAHPYLSTGLQMTGGGAALMLAPEVEGAALGTSVIPRALGMVGKLRTAAPLAAATGAGLGAADAAARGEDVKQGAIGGALSGAGAVVGGKAVGMVYDAARGMFRPAASQRFLPGGPVAGVDVPVSQGQYATAMGQPDVAATREEERLRKAGNATAVQADQATNQAMQQAHSNFAGSLDPTGQSLGVNPLDAGEAASGDLVTQEQQRAAAEVARMTGARGATQPIRQTMTGAAAPASVSDVGDIVSQGIANRFGQARAARTQAYQDYGNVPGEFNPRDLLNMGERAIRPAMDNPQTVGLPRSERVYVKPELMPNTSAALQTIDHEMGQLALTNEVARGNRPITSEDIEEVRKILVQYQGAANAAARAGQPNAWQDARGMQRLMQEFDRHMLDVVTRPGGFSGDAQAYMDAQAAARQSHVDLRRTFSRQIPGDKVGTFMENALGKVPGQEMSGDKIMQQLLGSPDRPGNEMSPQILAHLRDNVFGANSPEWNQIRQAAIAHMTETPAGAEPVPLDKIASRLERFLANDRQANELLTPNEQALLAQHAADLRSAPDEPLVPGSVEAKLSAFSGRGGAMPAGGKQLMTQLLGPNGDQLAAGLRDRLLARGQAGEDIWNQLRQGLFQYAAEAPQGLIPWEHQKTSQQIGKFLNLPVAREMYSQAEQAEMRNIAAAHQALIPTRAGTNPSGTAFMLAHMAKGLRRQFINGLGLTTHGLHGLVTSTAINRALDEASSRLEAKEAQRLFIGRHPGSVSTAPQRIGALAGPQLTRQLQDQSSQ